MPENVTRRDFLNRSALAAGALSAAAGMVQAQTTRPAGPMPVPCGALGSTKISRLMLGGNLVSGYMHCRDLKYVNDLFKAYVTEQKMMETLALAEKHGINTVFETGANFVKKYNRDYNGKMQFIPHINVNATDSDEALKTHIKKQVDSGAVALYVWGVAGDKLVASGESKHLVRAVEFAKKHNIPVGVGGHSLLVPMECEKLQVPCDFYVKTFHHDNYPSATPKELRKEFIWMSGGKGWYDNMWCINPEETAAFMKTVKKPWVAFKVLAAGAILPKDGFDYAFKNGADLIAVGMFDFQIKANAVQAIRSIRDHQNRERPWCA